METAQQVVRREAIVDRGGPLSDQRTILVAEQDHEVRGALAAALRADGYEIIEAANGLELLDQLGSILLCECSTGEPDAIILDAQIPGVSGSAILRALRDVEWPSPIVVLMNEGGRRLWGAPERLGASAVFDMPFDIDDIRTVVLNIVPLTQRTPRGLACPPRRAAPRAP